MIALCLGIVKSSLDQRFAIALFFIATRYPKTIDIEVIGCSDGHPSKFGRSVFDEDLGPLIQAAKDIAVVKLATQPVFFGLVTIGTFFIGNGTADVFLCNVVWVELNEIRHSIGIE